MGLSAAQARLLTITSRKSDCEFQSMRYSHEKIALSRSMNDVSAEYQRALEQTKLVFDYYGSGDQSTPVSYGLFMQPSQANGFLPILTTNAQNRIVLTSPYAEAARAAGIPQEGLSSLPSTEVRNRFLTALGEKNIITETQANTYKSIPYSQTIGMGTQDLVVTNMDTVYFNDLLTMLGSTQVTIPKSSYGGASVAGNTGYQGKTVTLNDLWTKNVGAYYFTDNNRDNDDKYNEKDRDVEVAKSLAADSNSFVSTLRDALYTVFGNALNPYIQDSIEYAYDQIYGILKECNFEAGKGNSGTGFALYKDTWIDDEDDYPGVGNSENHCTAATSWIEKQFSSSNNNKYVGYVALHSRGTDGRWARSACGISYSNVYKAFLTYFAQKYETLTYGPSNYKATQGSRASVSASGDHRIKSDSGNFRLDKVVDSRFSVDVETSVGINSDEALLSGYWDALLNNLCAYGWTENNNVSNNEYLQEMYKSGRLFISTCNDDGYYYQTSYSTLSSVREITDDEAAAKAEAKYNAEKQKINHKEQIIDMKMKNLDTEISALSSEYETIKGLLSKNIERAFTRYKA